MHVEKILIENLFYMLIGARGEKDKDDAKSRKDIVVHYNRPELELKDNRHRLLMPKAKQDAQNICP